MARLTVGLIADPDAVTELAEDLLPELGDRMAADDPELRVEIDMVSEPVTVGDEGPDRVLERVVQRAGERSWDAVVALTELPMRVEGRPMMLQASTRDRAVVMSVPAIAGMRSRRRAARMVTAVLRELTRIHLAREGTRSREETVAALQSLLPGRSHESGGGSGPADVRLLARPVRGRIRLLLGMVRANEPWRLLPELSKAMVAALATGAIATVNSTVWSLSGAMGVDRLAVATLGSVGLMVVWFVVDADLWHHVSDGTSAAREKATLYNVSTLLTLGSGVVICYAVLFLVNLLWALFVVDAGVYHSITGRSADPSTYLTLAWLVASVATAGGALGSSLESDEAIRAAAYSKREQARREAVRAGQQPTSDRAGDDAG